MNFDPTTATPDAPPKQFDPGSASPAQETTPGGPQIQNTGQEPGSAWRNLYAGLNGLDDRLTGQQQEGLKLIDGVSQNPQEARATAINQSFLQGQMPGMDPRSMATNWPAVKEAYVKSRFGIDKKDMSDTELYGLISKRFQDEKEAQAPGEDGKPKPWTWVDKLETYGKVDWQILKDFHESIGSRPWKELPDAPTEKLPNIPELGMMNPKLAGLVFNIVKPQIEGFETPEGIASLAVGGGLGKLAEGGVVAAKAALTGMTGLFSGIMAAQAVTGAKTVRQAFANPQASTMDKARAVANEVANVGGALLGPVAMALHLHPKAAMALEGQTPSDAAASLQEMAASPETKPEAKVALMSAAQELHKVSGDEPPIMPREPVEEPPAPAAETKTEQPPPPPAEPAPPITAEVPRESGLVGIKNEAVDAEMKKMGLDPAQHGESISFEDAKADADAKLAADPFAGQKLVESLKGKPRPITGQEDALLLTEVNRLRLERDSAETAMLDAKKTGDQEAEAEASVRIAKARDDFAEAEQVSTKVGTVNAQGLALRRMMMREDYSLASMERQLAAATKDGKLTPEQEGKVRDIHQRIQQTQADLDKYNARRLKAFKTRTERATEEMKAKLAAGDLSKKPRPEPVKLDPEAEILQAEHQRVKQEFQTEVIKSRLAQRTPFERMQDTFVKWRRGFLLSGPVTLAKLTTAALERIAITPAEEAVGAGLGKIPGVDKIAKEAPRQGGINAAAEAHAITQGFTAGMSDAANLLRTGKGNLEVLYGHGKDSAVRESDILPRSAIDFLGQIHGALKAPVKRAEFTRSFEKRMAFAISRGADGSNPLVQSRIAIEAYKDANRSIFLQNNMLTDAYQRALSRFDQPDKTSGQPTAGGKAAGTIARALLPIVKVPTNIVAETVEYATGLLTGSLRLANAYRVGIEKLNPEQADLIMRELKKGTLGGAALLLGYFNADKVGGYYQPGVKRKKGDVGFDDVRIFGHDVPGYLLHNPLLETLQIGATARRVADAKFAKKDAAKAGLGSGVWAAAMGLIDEIPFAREATELGKIFGGGPEGRYAAGEFAKGLVTPAASQWAAQHLDTDSHGNPIKRAPKTMLEHVKTGIPGLREEVPKAKKQPQTVSFNARQPHGGALRVTMDSGKAEKLLSSRLDSLKKLRDTLPA